MTVTIDNILHLLQSKILKGTLIISLLVSVATIYSTLVVDSAIHFCNFDYHNIALPKKVNKYLTVDFLLSR